MTAGTMQRTTPETKRLEQCAVHGWLPFAVGARFNMYIFQHVAEHVIISPQICLKRLGRLNLVTARQRLNYMSEILR